MNLISTPHKTQLVTDYPRTFQKISVSLSLLLYGELTCRTIHIQYFSCKIQTCGLYKAVGFTYDPENLQTLILSNFKSNFKILVFFPPSPQIFFINMCTYRKECHLAMKPVPLVDRNVRHDYSTESADNSLDHQLLDHSNRGKLHTSALKILTLPNIIVTI